MSKIEELDKLDRAIKDAEISLKSIQNNIEKIDKEISVLDPRKNELEQNIEFHKKSNTIPLAHEYKKAKAELSKIKARLILLTADRKKAHNATIDIEIILDKYRTDHAELLKNSENNVLNVIFGAKRGKR